MNTQHIVALREQVEGRPPIGAAGEIFYTKVSADDTTVGNHQTGK